MYIPFIITLYIYESPIDGQWAPENIRGDTPMYTTDSNALFTSAPFILLYSIYSPWRVLICACIFTMDLVKVCTTIYWRAIQLQYMDLYRTCQIFCCHTINLVYSSSFNTGESVEGRSLVFKTERCSTRNGIQPISSMSCRNAVFNGRCKSWHINISRDWLFLSTVNVQLLYSCVLSIIGA